MNFLAGNRGNSANHASGVAPGMARHAELQGILDKVLVIDPRRAIAKIGRFVALGNASLPEGAFRPIQVEWTDPQTKKPDEMIHSKEELTQAFPSALRKCPASAGTGEAFFR